MEEWRPVPGFEDWYEASSEGRLRSYHPGNARGKRRETPRAIKCSPDPRGYVPVHLHAPGKKKRIWLHQLIAQVFIPNPRQRREINHKNGKKSDCRVVNLEWVSRSQNIRHAYENGLLKHVGLRGEKSPIAALTEDQAQEMRRIYDERELTHADLAKMFSVSTATVYRVLHRQSRTCANDGPKILDACCGSRMFWFDKKHPDALYIDNRTMPPTLQTNGATITVAPDQVMDFRKLDLPDNSFSLIVFDPPHIIKRGGKRSWMKEKYGELGRDTWRDDIRQGFAQLFRVLKDDGVLIFKWNETDILLSEVLKLSPYRPLFGHRSGKAQKTHWVTFMKSATNMIH